MKRSTSGILLLAGLFALLVAINFIFSSTSEQASEDEFNGNRSSYRSTPYGTLAFYTLLEDSGYKVTRLHLSFERLAERPDIAALVIVAPPTHRNPSGEELQALADWIEEGGVAVIVDRQIALNLRDVKINTAIGPPPRGIHPLQPTPFTRNVGQLDFSAYATGVTIDSPTTVYHLGDDRVAVLADASVGKGRVVTLTDPYVVANNGISKADNAILAVDLFADLPDGAIAFDEYHHGVGASEDTGLSAYVKGTPIPWMLAQAALIVALVVYSYGRRFGRPLPLKRERRTANLEFVSGMANITRLARASDVAMQNIYFEFRKRLCRYAGLPSKSETRSLVSAVAVRSGLDEGDLRRLLTHCEDVTRGEPAKDEDLLKTVVQIREIESKLKL